MANARSREGDEKEEEAGSQARTTTPNKPRAREGLYVNGRADDVLSAKK